MPYRCALGTSTLELLMARSDEDMKMEKPLSFKCCILDFETSLLLASAAICKNGGVTDLESRAYVIENKVKTLTITTFLFPSKKVLRAAISPGMNDVFPRSSGFSSNFPIYVPPPSPDSVPTSPRKTYSSASNSFGILPPSTPSQPQVLEIGKTSRKSAINRHEEQIKGIQCYLEEIPPERFEQIENGIEGLGKGTI
ncbi:hypothetical protein Tco_0691492, partial [Tanacetum coccineum]